MIWLDDNQCKWLIKDKRGLGIGKEWTMVCVG